ncbi:ROK family protein [Lacticaseibacillus daqingensis]|uniref:ROK family protein n=1 Tax=Lacticaseibacillus daqingensis TaxID=2486014 RepID=UPI000F7A52CC|nr:ROK family protein [Lacticaseibacillus daqingensis]
MTVGSIEAGGTKFVVAVADDDMKQPITARIPTTDPVTTLNQVIQFFRTNPVDSLSIGSFGPLCLDHSAPNYGALQNTPKPGWAGINMYEDLIQALNIPVQMTTDVNASAYGEYYLFNRNFRQKPVKSLAYLTIGTGIGGGFIEGGHVIGESGHPEVGHMWVEPRADDDFEGGCPYHGNHCYEGLASGSTISARTGERGENLARTHRVFDLIQYYTAQLAWNIYVTMHPERIIIGGSVLNVDDLTGVRQYFNDFNHDYLAVPDLTELIQPPLAAHNGSATIGNFLLARHAVGISGDTDPELIMSRTLQDLDSGIG